ncbi:CdaR family protein [Clostridium uliginosum]|uniref:YbbR domain-containing protein n=1 Tax=Clostridium uliginosum TaxID=119641 RepID=A0A1I1MDG8_9CLOT|nr:CdaR family protein [Clostridium uliginosum]SFC82882.1 YbbR domain-containing protein [Clostridium uliginosum]
MGKGNKNQSLIVKFICLFLSFGLWLYISNVENPVRTYELKGVPVELINQSSISDANLAIVENQSFTVDLKLEGASSDITKAKKESFKLTADMSAYALKDGDNVVPIQIVSYPENVTVKNNGFLGIKVKLEPLISKDVSLKSQVSVSYKENIYQQNQSISPKKITISGPKSTIDRVSEGVLIGDAKDIAKDFQKKYNISFLDNNGKEVAGVKSNYNEGELLITVSNGKTVPINIQTTGSLNKGLSIASMELSPKEIHIIGDNKNLSKITSIDTEAVNLTDLQSDQELNLKLMLPEGVTVQAGNESIKAKITLNNDTSTIKDTNTTKDISCKVEYINLNEKFILESSTETTKITISGLQSILEKISSSDVKVVVDLANISVEGKLQQTPTATILGQNEGVTVASVGNVEISVKKKV